MKKEDLINLKKKVLELKQAGEIEKILKYDTPYRRLKQIALEIPDKPALLYFGNIITYRQLLTLVDIAAKGFSELGIKYNDVVTMSLLSTPYGIVSFYALDKIGAVMHMVNSATSIEEIKHQLDIFDSKYFVANDIFYNKKIQEILKEKEIEKVITISLLDSLPQGFSIDKTKYTLIEKLKGIKKKDYIGSNICNFEQLLELGRNSKIDLKEIEFVPNKKVTVASTSGSTGNSKACLATWEGLDSMLQVMAMTEEGRFEQGDIMLVTFPLWIYYSLLNMIHEPLSLGVTLALDPLFDPKNIVKRNRQYNFNHWLTIPPYIKKMTDMNKKTDCSKWKIVLTGGDVLTEKVKSDGDKYIQRNGGKTSIGQGYGSSECLGSFAYTYYDNATTGSVGIPCVGNKFKVLDVETNNELGPNEIGVGYCYTPARMREYFGDLEATKHNLVMDSNGAIWYNTEDLMHYNEKGEIFVDGRIRRIALTLDSNGNPTKIIPEKAKKIISQVDGVSKCEVITVPDEERTNRSVAFIISDDKDENIEELKQKIFKYCKDNLAEYMIPKEILSISEIPLNSSKKPDFKALEEIYDLHIDSLDKSKRKRLIK